MYRVLLLDGFDKVGVERLKQHPDFLVEAREEKLSAESLAEAIRDVHFLGVRSGTKVGPEHFLAAQELLSVGRAGVGVDNIATSEATKYGVVVSNAGNETAVAVAELTIAQMLNLSRGIVDANSSICNGKWEKKKFIGTELRGKTLGIIGYGQIGSLVSKYALAFGMRIIIFEPDKAKWESNGSKVRFVENIEELYAAADIITLHVPLVESTRNMICETTLNQMKRGVLLINTSRGGIIKHQDVFSALKDGRVGGFAADVFPTEPPDSVLAPALEKTIWTPHIGGQSQEGQAASSLAIAEQFISYMERGRIANSVNFPAVNPDEMLEHPGNHRTIVIHWDEPGALHRITGPFDQQEINISDQMLRRKVRNGVVYTIIDTDEAVSEEVITQVKGLTTKRGLPFVIRVRHFAL